MSVSAAYAVSEIRKRWAADRVKPAAVALLEQVQADILVKNSIDRPDDLDCRGEL